MRSLFDHPVLGRGFRPFFLLGALYSVFSLLVWSGFYADYIMPSDFMIPTHVLHLWHAHEMIYGYTLAIVAGFLLTAVANWTGGAPARQIHLAGLCALWLSGRMVMNFDLGLPFWLAYVVECSFIPALALSLSIPLLKRGNKRNFVFLALLTALFFCDVAFFALKDVTPLYVAVMMIVTMISLIGGRVIPAFTVAALKRRGEDAYQTPQHKLDIIAPLSMGCIILAMLFIGTQGMVLAITAFTSAVIHGLRMRHYNTLRIFSDPLVWILHIGYGWVIAGLCFLGLGALGFLPFSTALHALTAGAIGSMTLGMMCRVALGHTGRSLVAGKVTSGSFWLMQIAAFMRVLGPLMFPEYSNEWVIGSAVLWALCFALYIAVYAPMLWTLRPDGRQT